MNSKQGWQHPWCCYTYRPRNHHCQIQINSTILLSCEKLVLIFPRNEINLIEFRVATLIDSVIIRSSASL